MLFTLGRSGRSSQIVKSKVTQSESLKYCNTVDKLEALADSPLLGSAVSPMPAVPSVMLRQLTHKWLTVTAFPVPPISARLDGIYFALHTFCSKITARDFLQESKKGEKEISHQRVVMLTQRTNIQMTGSRSEPIKRDSCRERIKEIMSETIIEQYGL
ncbi:hypothetical protein J6590_060270 [Homalodisca vitripennis]|nr:hypothetical protein J6590_060270 [Homalodisca vitripennis]